jgi:hypothetical protein
MPMEWDWTQDASAFVEGEVPGTELLVERDGEEQWIPVEELGDNEDYSLISIPEEYAALEAVEGGYTVTLNNVAHGFASFDTAAQALYTYHETGELPKNAVEPVPGGHSVTIDYTEYGFTSFDTAAQALYTYDEMGELPKNAAWIAIIDPMRPAT